jgi:hypothetical protein
MPSRKSSKLPKGGAGSRKDGQGTGNDPVSGRWLPVIAQTSIH